MDDQQVSEARELTEALEAWGQFRPGDPFTRNDAIKVVAYVRTLERERDSVGWRERVSPYAELLATNADLRATNKRLKMLLREHEWCAVGGCASCGHDKRNGHSEWCPMAAELGTKVASDSHQKAVGKDER